MAVVAEIVSAESELCACCNGSLHHALPSPAGELATRSPSHTAATIVCLQSKCRCRCRAATPHHCWLFSAKIFSANPTAEKLGVTSRRSWRGHWSYRPGCWN